MTRKETPSVRGAPTRFKADLTLFGNTSFLPQVPHPDHHDFRTANPVREGAPFVMPGTGVDSLNGQIHEK
jgi:hypothetical protein